MIISIIIPNYNGVELLEKNLSKVLDSAKFYGDKTNDQVEIIVVDDASSDESVRIIKEKIKSIDLKKVKLRLLENKKNRGFSTTINKGVKESKGEIVVLLNTDVYPEHDFLIPLISRFKEKDVFAVGCLDKSIEGGKTILRGRGVGKWKGGFLTHSRGEINKEDTLWASGGGSAFKKSIWEKLGELDELYNPFYWEDIDISYRALKSGYKVLFEPRSVIFHQHDIGAIRKEYSKFRIKIIAYKNQFIFVWKNATDFLLQLTHILYLPYHLAVALKNRDWPFFLGLLLALLSLPKIIKSGFRAQKMFVLKDADVIKNLNE